MQRVYTFDDDSKPDKKILGGKGAALKIMTQLGLPIPPGFVISTNTCIDFLKNNSTYPEDLWDQAMDALKKVEKKLDKKFNDPENPLLLSIRSGAAISMPGMMDTVLNCGLNDVVVEGLIKKTKNAKFVKDAYRRLIQMFADVVCNLDIQEFNKILDELKQKNGLNSDNELTSEHLDELLEQYKSVFKKLFGSDFPQDPLTQLDMAIKAVFNSWNNDRAIAYRNFENIPHDIGTAVSVQAMVFGNFDDNSGTGVLFSRDPSSGKNHIFGEYLVNAQGEDVVAGIRTPQSIDELKNQWPELYKDLEKNVKILETHFKDMQDIEFTVQEGRLFLLQTRAGKRTGKAAAKIATDMVKEGLITKEEAILRITARDIEEAIFPHVLWKVFELQKYADIDDLDAEIEAGKSVNEIIFDASSKPANLVGKGLPAGPGAASGHVVFSSDLAERIVKGEAAPFEITEFDKKRGGIPRLILVKHETSPEDFHGMVASQGILTMTGGMTSHAALVGRQIGKRVIVGAGTSGLDLRGDVLRTKKGDLITEGDIITIEVIDDGFVYFDNLPIVTPDNLPEELEQILIWSDEIAQMKVRSNSDKEDDTLKAIMNKSTGTGLARTEHQFFDALDTMREMILAETEEDQRVALNKMEELQKEDFTKLFTVSDGRPVTIRLLDPPLHEFLPSELEIRQNIYDQVLDPEQTAENSRILRKVLYYQEANPMLGLRGVRLGLMIPRIIRIQSRAIIEAAIEVKAKGIDVKPEIMIPLISTDVEFQKAREIVDKAANDVFEKRGTKIDYQVGTMIEIPRAALTADQIAEGKMGADFFSFGTNDLTQMSLGFSRDDVGKFLPFYLDNNILPVDPFQSIDTVGVGKLMKMTVADGRASAKKSGKYLKVGLCGEQGGDPTSIDFCYQIGLDYVSCSPFRIPVARLSAAQATLKYGEVDSKYGKVWPTPKN